MLTGRLVRTPLIAMAVSFLLVLAVGGLLGMRADTAGTLRVGLAAEQRHGPFGGPSVPTLVVSLRTGDAVSRAGEVSQDVGLTIVLAKVAPDQLCVDPPPQGWQLADQGWGSVTDKLCRKLAGDERDVTIMLVPR